MSKIGRIELDHFYTQPPAGVWRALTDPELHAKWWAAGDVRPIEGHRFTLDMGEWGQQQCEVLEVQPERLLRYRFAIGTLDTVITWQLIPEGSGTRLRLIQDGFDLDSPLSREALEGMGNGWPELLQRIATLLSNS